MSELLLSSFINFLSSKGLISQAYIVGGVVRDIIAAKPLRDIDVAVIRDAVGLGNEFAALTGSTAVPFDRKSATVRVARGGFFIDISSFKGNAIEDDLQQRDITINAMALPLSLAANGLISAEAKDSIIDPLGGLNDLAAKTVRMVSEENLQSDPVRLLRIYRFAATLGFSVDEATAEAAARLAPLAGSSAPERLAEELRHIFSMQDSADAVRMMRDNRLLENILPETKGQLDISMTRYAAIETAIAAFMQISEDKDMTALMSITMPHVIFSLKYAALMPDVRAAAQSAASLRLSNTETELITFFTGIRSEILTTFRKLPEQPAETEIIRIILAAGGSPVGACMSALAQLQAEEGAERTAEFIKFSGAVAGYFQDVFIPRAALLPLVTGEEIMDRFGLAQSPLVGECLKHIGNLVILGLVSTKSESLKAVEDLISSKNAS